MDQQDHTFYSLMNHIKMNTAELQNYKINTKIMTL